MADRVGLSAPTLTQRFGSKRSLLLAYAEAAATGIEDPFNRARSNSPTALSALRAALLQLTAGIDSRTRSPTTSRCSTSTSPTPTSAHTPRNRAGSSDEPSHSS